MATSHSVQSVWACSEKLFRCSSLPKFFSPQFQVHYTRAQAVRSNGSASMETIICHRFTCGEPFWTLVFRWSNRTYMWIFHCQTLLPRSSGTSRRTTTNPLGAVHHASVALGNLLCARTLIIVLICASIRGWWLVEQPQGSWMEPHPLFQEVLQLLDVWRHRFEMKIYGAPSSKPTWIYSSDLLTEHVVE